MVVIDTESHKLVGEIKEIGTTYKLDPKTGAVISQKTATDAGLKVQIKPGTDECYFSVRMTGSASDPLVFGAPEINYEATFVIDHEHGVVYWEVDHDPFPAHQLSIDDNLVHTFSGVGRTPFSLFPFSNNITSYGRQSFR